jgi:hypothetical protein
LPAPLEPISDTSSPWRLEVHALDSLNAAIGHLQALDLQQAPSCCAVCHLHAQCPPVPR